MTGSTPVRVLHLCAGNLYGGVERIVSECAEDRALCPEMVPAFAVCFEGRLAAELDAFGSGCARLGGVSIRRPWTVWSARRRLAMLLREAPSDVVVCHSSWIYGLAAPVVRRTTRKLVLWLHDRVSGASWPERWAARTRPDLIIANSRFTGASVPALYSDAVPAVLYAPVRSDTSGSERGQLRASLGVRERTPVIVVASRFEKWKGHRALLEAVAQIAEPWHLWVAGRPQRADETEYERDLRAFAQARGIGSRVTFLGERRDVAACLRAADIHCQPNIAPEPFGLTFVEALYAGLPIVTTALGGALEILTDACGVLVAPGDEAALTAALRRLVLDPDARTRLGHAGPARARQLCDPARQLAALASLLGAHAQVPA